MSYEDFVRVLEARPATLSPLMFVATMPSRPPQSSEWLLRWAKEQRA